MLCMLGSIYANRDKIIKHIKCLCCANKVETGNAVFKTRISVFLLLAGATLDVVIYSSVSQTVVRGPQVVLGFCPCGPFRLNISPKKTEKIKLT